MMATADMNILRMAELCVASLCMSASLVMPASGQSGGPDWQAYSDRFGTRVEYPAAIFSDRREQREDGLLLSRSDGRAHISILAIPNEQGESPDRFLARRFPYDRSSLSYDRVTRHFFAVSMRSNGKIHYSRCNFATLIHCVELAYPLSEKRAFDPIVTRISLSLRPLN
jgi:hypothetical protein